MLPPARAAELLYTRVSLTTRLPLLLRMPPPEPEPLVAVLSKASDWNTNSVPPSLNRPPPPLSAAVPWATLPTTRVAPTAMVPAPEFQRPPPSEAAVFRRTREKNTSTVPLPVRCRPPPLPGLGPVVLRSRVATTTRVRPPFASIAPPARSARLKLRVVRLTSRVPPSLKTAPPDAPSPVTRLSMAVTFWRVSWPVVRKAPPDSPAGVRPPTTRVVRIDARALRATSKARSPRAEMSIVEPVPWTVTSRAMSRSPEAALALPAPVMVRG